MLPGARARAGRARGRLPSILRTALLDAEFSADALEAQLAQRAFDIVHIASHGEFSTERAAESFVLTYEGRLGMERLGGHRRRDPLPRAPGRAARAERLRDRGRRRARGARPGGRRRARRRAQRARDAVVGPRRVGGAAGRARSTRELRRPGVSRAVALQRAQLHLLRDTPYKHPAYWSPFLLINSWL